MGVTISLLSVNVSAPRLISKGKSGASQDLLSTLLAPPAMNLCGQYFSGLLVFEIVFVDRRLEELHVVHNNLNADLLVLSQ